MYDLDKEGTKYVFESEVEVKSVASEILCTFENLEKLKYSFQVSLAAYLLNM